MQGNNKISADKPAEARDALDLRFEQMMERAILSPVISNSQQIDYKKFVNFFELPIYRLGIGLLVIFLDSSKYGTRFGSFYPFWTLQSGYVSKKNTNIKISLLTAKQADRAVALSNRIVELFENSAVDSNVYMRRDAENFEWRVPFSENEIARLDKAFQDLIIRRRA